ncbi:hypothetical protein WJX73_002949 [Symbiochloris irregularis]|uniref:Uncharacterized protein n=1 Tax=Symbiochloris irregularis TaxID=706552 RepID=A0AAW1PRN1_9CHLO
MTSSKRRLSSAPEFCLATATSRQLNSRDVAETLSPPVRCRLGNCQVSVASANQQAAIPASDSHVVKVQDNEHAFAAIFTAASNVSGLSYLRVKLHQHLQAQMRLQQGSVTAVPAALASIGAAFRRLAPSHNDLFEGVSFTFVYLDMAHEIVYLASKGVCKTAACSLQEKKALLVSDNHTFASTDAKENEGVQVQSLALDSHLDSIVLGSTGFWQELAPAKALLRLGLFYQEAPLACNSNPAAHLTNFGLHAVTQRMGRLSDPRMCALSSVSALQRLYMGSRDNFPGHDSLPLLRRRGDVHGDMTVIVLRLSWSGLHNHLPDNRYRKCVSFPQGSAYAPTHIRPSAAEHWSLLRMHFRTFPAASRQLTLRKWDRTLAALQEVDRMQTGEELGTASETQRSNAAPSKKTGKRCNSAVPTIESSTAGR